MLLANSCVGSAAESGLSHLPENEGGLLRVEELKVAFTIVLSIWRHDLLIAPALQSPIAELEA